MSFPTPVARFFVANPFAWTSVWNDVRHELPPARIRVLDNAVILPIRNGNRMEAFSVDFEGGVQDKDGRFVAGLVPKVRMSSPMGMSCNRAYPVDATDIETRDESVVFGGVLFDHYGHLITDSTARLWYLAGHPEDNRKVVFVKTPSMCLVPEDPMPFLQLLGLPAERIEIVERPTRFRQVVVPEQAMYAYEGFRPEWASVFDLIRSNVPPSPYRKIYFSRARFQKGDTLNEDIFENYYRDRGFHIVYPEECSVREEISLTAGADELVATIGTLSHQFVFAKPGAHATVLCRTDTPLKRQLMIGAARHLQCDYVEAHRNALPTTHNNGAFFLYPTLRFNRYLRQRGFPPVGENRYKPILGDRERVRRYVRKWFEMFVANGRTPLLAGIRRSGTTEAETDSMQSLLQTAKSDVEKQTDIVTDYVLSRLAIGDAWAGPTETAGPLRRFLSWTKGFLRRLLRPRHESGMDVLSGKFPHWRSFVVGNWDRRAKTNRRIEP